MKTKKMTAVVALVTGTFLAFSGIAQGGLQDGLVAWYPFQGNADNAGGVAPNGTANGPTTTTDRFGTANSAYAFDGVDDYVEVPNTNGVFDLTNSWTLACWAKPFSPSTNGCDDPLIWKIAVSSTELYAGDEDTFLLSWGYLWQNEQGSDLFCTGLERATDGYDFGLNSVPHTPGAWHHVVGTYDGAYLKVYVDGDSEGMAYIGPVVAYTGPAALRIGNIQNSAHIFGPTHIGAFDGAIDDVRIYDRALSGTEVADLYALPEPATLSLLALGGLAMLRRRRR